MKISWIFHFFLVEKLFRASRFSNGFRFVSTFRIWTRWHLSQSNSAIPIEFRTLFDVPLRVARLRRSLSERSCLFERFTNSEISLWETSRQCSVRLFDWKNSSSSKSRRTNSSSVLRRWFAEISFRIFFQVFLWFLFVSLRLAENSSRIVGRSEERRLFTFGVDDFVESRSNQRAMRRNSVRFAIEVRRFSAGRFARRKNRRAERKFDEKSISSIHRSS